MTTLKIRQLIDMAIGTPDPGHVNFNALYCLLNCFAEKLEICDEKIDYSKYEALVFRSSNKESYDLSKLTASKRLYGGYNPDIETPSKADQISEPAPSNESTALDITEPETFQIETSKSEVEAKTYSDFEPADEIPKSSIKEQSFTETHTEADEIPKSSIKEQSFTETHTEADEIPKSSIKEQSFTETHTEDPLVQVPSSSALKYSVNSREKSIASELSFQKLGSHIAKTEMVEQKIKIPEEFSAGISIMKDQLELAVEQLLLLTFLTLSRKPDSKQIQQLYTRAQMLNSMRKENIFIEKSNRLEFDTVPSLNWNSLELQMNKDISEEELLNAHSSDSKYGSTKTDTNQYELEDHFCYSPEKILDQLMELKAEFCRLANKVNEISARLLQQESEHTLALITEIQEQIRDIKLTEIRLKEKQDRMEIRTTSAVENIDSLKISIEDIFEEKVDKAELEILLADKVTNSQLKLKVSLDQLLEIQCLFDKKFSEILRQIKENEKKFGLIVENLQNTLGFATIEGILNAFKEQVDKKILTLQELFQKYIDATNDECAASGARIKVLQDLACLSCDTNCVMRTMEKAKVAKLPSAHASNILSPLITYELGSIRKSGIMGYYRKDEFPHAPNAWMKRQGGELTLKQCVPRHMGGQHTTSTAKERVEKVMLNKK